MFKELISAPKSVSELTHMAEGQCIHPRWWRKGFSKNGKQKYICPLCRTHRTEKGRVRMTRFERALKIAPLFGKGWTTKRIAREMGWPKNTALYAVQLLRQVLDSKGFSLKIGAT